jgi:hypothetical protein
MKAESDEWNTRSAAVGAAILREFPRTPFDPICLRQLIKNTAHPGAFTRVDDELLDFLTMLQKLDWSRIDWHRHWLAMAILPKPVFDYCLPGIMYWFAMDPNPMWEAAEFLIDDHLAPIDQRGKVTFDFSCFSSTQKRIIAQFLSLLHDFTMDDDVDFQTKTRRVINSLSHEDTKSDVQAGK